MLPSYPSGVHPGFTQAGNGRPDTPEGAMTKFVLTRSQKDIPVLIGLSDAIRHSLVANHAAGRGAPNEVVGNEREVFVRGYLEAAYPRALLLVRVHHRR